jgi:hypothetical protein
MVRYAVAAVGFAGVLACSACSLLFNADGYASDGGPLADSGRDATLDAPARDGGPFSDGGDHRDGSHDGAPSDASTDRASDVSSPSFCASLTPPIGARYYECLDFDEGDASLGSRRISCAGCVASPTIEVDSGGFSPPKALIVTIPPLTASESANARLYYEDASAPSTWSMSFEARVEGVVTASIPFLKADEILYYIEFPGPTFVEMDFSDGGGLEKHPVDAGMLEMTKWHLYSLSLDESTTRGVLSIDGTVVFDGSLGYPVSGLGIFEVGVLIVPGPLPTGVDFAFDNVVMIGQ